MLKKGTISKVREYYLEQDETIFLDAMREFFDRPDLRSGNEMETTQGEENLFIEWLFFDYKLKNGKTMLKDFYESNPFGLSKNDLSIYKNLQENIYGLYKIKKVDVGRGLYLENLRTMKKYFVHEFSGSLEAKSGDSVFGRIGKVEDHYELVGCDATVISANFGENFLNDFRKFEDTLTPKTIRGICAKKADQSHRLTKEEFSQERKEIEECIVELLGRSESDFSLADVKDAIYNEEEQDDMMHVMAMFDRGRPDELSEVLDLVTDAWNYFPHKSLNGLSPMEITNK